jgi:hypothetical protein
MGFKLEEIRALAGRRRWRIAPIRPAPGKYVQFRGSAESNLPPMTLAQIHRWLMLPARQRDKVIWLPDGKMVWPATRTRTGSPLPSASRLKAAPPRPRRKACDIEAILASGRGSLTMTTGGPGMIAVSMLSDLQELIAKGDAEQARQMLNRVKRLLADDIVEPFIKQRG